MAELKINGKTVVTQTGSNEPIIGSNVNFNNAVFPAGHIIQVKQIVKTDYFNSQSTSFVDINGLSISITPNFNTSKILVMWSVATSGNSHFDLRLARLLDSLETAPYIGNQLGSNRTRSTHHHYTTTSYNTTYDTYSDNGQFLDSPNTTNSVTYKMQCACPYSSGYYIRIGYQYSDGDNTWAGTNPSSMTVMEIAG
jgi:hypothetical protein